MISENSEKTKDKPQKYHILAKSIVFSSLVILGGITMSVIAFANVDWFYPIVFFGIAAFIAWNNYL